MRAAIHPKGGEEGPARNSLLSGVWGPGFSNVSTSLYKGKG